MPETQQRAQPEAEQQAPTLTRAGLVALYAELGEKTHTIHELAARLAEVSARQQQLVDGLRRFEADHGDGKCRPLADGAGAERSSQLAALARNGAE